MKAYVYSTSGKVPPEDVEINTLDDLLSFIPGASEVIVSVDRKAPGADLMRIEIYDDYRE